MSPLGKELFFPPYPVLRPSLLSQTLDSCLLVKIQEVCCNAGMARKGVRISQRRASQLMSSPRPSPTPSHILYPKTPSTHTSLLVGATLTVWMCEVGLNICKYFSSLSFHNCFVQVSFLVGWLPSSKHCCLHLFNAFTV